MKKLHILLFMSAGLLVADVYAEQVHEKKGKSAKKSVDSKKAEDAGEVHSVKRDIRILKQDMKKKKMSHHDVNSFAYRIECFIKDLKKDEREATKKEKELKKASIAHLVKMFHALPQEEQDSALQKRVMKLKNHCHKSAEHEQVKVQSNRYSY